MYRLRSGSYVYVESSNHKKGDQAWLASKMLEFPTPQCMSFYYSMYGKLIGSLTLYIAPEGKKWIKLFMKSGNQGPNWQNADVTLDYKGKFQVSFTVGLFLCSSYNSFFILFCFYDFRHKDRVITTAFDNHCGPANPHFQLFLQRVDLLAFWQENRVLVSHRELAIF